MGVVCPCRGSVVGSRFAVAGVYGAGQCFCPFRTPWRCENCWGHGTPRPLFADACSCLGWPPRHAALASTGLAVARLAVDAGPVPGPGCTVCSADKRRPAAGRRASGEGCTALRGAPGDGRGARHLGPSLATALGAALNGWGGMCVVTTGWRRVVTTRSAGAVGAARWHAGAGLQQACRGFHLWGCGHPLVEDGQARRCKAPVGAVEGRWSTATGISMPCGCQVAGDQAGWGAHRSGPGDAISGISRADSANGVGMLRQFFLACNSTELRLKGNAAVRCADSSVDV